MNRRANRTDFDHERLEVYQLAIGFVAWSSDFLERIPAKLALNDQLDRASTSIPLNIAEGNGKFTPKDRCRFWDTARGSALECAACLDVAVAKGHADYADIESGKHRLVRIVSMLVGLIKSQPNQRLYEESEPYVIREDHDEQE